MAATRASGVRGHKRRTKSGRMVKVRQHARTVAYGQARGRKASQRGVFQARRALRHAAGRNAKGKRLRKYSKKRVAGYMAIGGLELIGWLVFRTAGGIFVSLALLFSWGGIVAMRGSATPKRRSSSGARSGGGKKKVVMTTKSGKGSKSKRGNETERKATKT
jgi:hypothetical protein